jgi:hypothetical protein
MRQLLCSSWTLCVAGILCAPLHAQDTITVKHCAGQDALTVPIQVDCSHVTDPATKALCPVFAENQACKVFPAYREITGLHVEDWCQKIQYIIYDKDKWPYKSGPASGAGGYTVGCRTQYMADYSVLFKTPIGPYDVHEILHIYQEGLGALPNTHILFGSSMAEATRLIGDTRWGAILMNQRRQEVSRIQAEFDKGSIAPAMQCIEAEVSMEQSLYLKDVNNVRQYYLILMHDGTEHTSDPQTRFNRMFNAVSGGTAKPYLLQHGCPSF